MNEVTTMALDLAHREHFTVPEWLEREKYIATVRQYEKARSLAEQALTQIRDRKLYRPYKSLKEFCQHLFGWSDRRTQQVLAAEKVVAALPEGKRTKITNERQARELEKVPEDKRAEVLDEAERFYSDNGEITTKGIEKAAARVVELPTDSMGNVIPEPALSYWNRRSEPKELINEINAIKKKIRSISSDDPMYANVGLQGVIGDLNSATSRLVAAIPAHVCPYCKGLKPEKCKECHGRGVMSDYVWKTAVPKTMKSDLPF